MILFRNHQNLIARLFGLSVEEIDQESKRVGIARTSHPKSSIQGERLTSYKCFQSPPFSFFAGKLQGILETIISPKHLAPDKERRCAEDLTVLGGLALHP